MTPVYLLEAVGSALPASFLGTEQSETPVKVARLAEALADLRGLTRSFRNLTTAFFFDFFAPVDEGWSAIDESESQGLGIAARHRVFAQLSRISSLQWEGFGPGFRGKILPAQKCIDLVLPNPSSVQVWRFG